MTPASRVNRPAAVAAFALAGLVAASRLAVIAGAADLWRRPAARAGQPTPRRR